jgi:deoxyribonuclease V
MGRSSLAESDPRTPSSELKVHSWQVSPREARAIQEDLRGQVIDTDDFGPIRRVAGVDVGFEDAGSQLRAAVAVLQFPSLQVVETAVARVSAAFPYVPGLLSFRELPGILTGLADLTEKPDLILCDGQGFAHPRRFGLACHLGVLADIPTIGVGKSRLLGQYREPGQIKGQWSELIDNAEVIGAVLRTRTGVKPLFVSVGHRVSLTSAIRLTLACTTRFKLPETTRIAHRLASA